MFSSSLSGGSYAYSINGGAELVFPVTSTLFEMAASDTAVSSFTLKQTNGGTSGGWTVYYFESEGVKLINSTGENSITGDPLEASATDVLGVDGNTLQIDGVSGTWKTGLHIKGAEISGAAPSPQSIVFTSSNGGSLQQLQVQMQLLLVVSGRSKRAAHRPVRGQLLVNTPI